MEVQTTRRAVWNRLLQLLNILRGSVTSVEESGTRQLIVDQEELAERDAMRIMIMSMK